MNTPRFATSTGKGCIVEATDGERVQPVCVCYGSEEPNGDAATARRIAALLNFAEGVPTEELIRRALQAAVRSS